MPVDYVGYSVELGAFEEAEVCMVFSAAAVIDSIIDNKFSFGE